MKPYLSDPDLTVYNGDALEVLRELPAESVQMCVTSPPFFGLRDYGMEGQIGLEPTPEDWVASLVAVFDEVKRVLRKDGTLWVECGDSYAGSWGAQSRENGSGQDSISAGQIASHPKQTRTGSIPAGSSLKPKDLIGQPFLLAFALREAGWYWRNVCIWHKPNPMPESVRDRFTVSHSYVLLFSKGPRYFFDAEAVREPHKRLWDPAKIGGSLANGSDRLKEAGRNDGGRELAPEPNPAGRNARSVWTIPTEPLPFEHYAAFPQALAERCIKAGSAPGDVVLDPFFGSGTSALVARRLGRKCIGIELNETYCKLAAERTKQLSLLGEDLSATGAAEAS